MTNTVIKTKSQIGRSSRTKGQQGEREIAKIINDYTGWEVKRKVRNHNNDSDLEGVPGWSIEVKRYKTATRSQIELWWNQAVNQAENSRPVLFYRKNNDEWRAVYMLISDSNISYENTVESSVFHWSNFARHIYYEGLREIYLLGIRGNGESYIAGC